MPEEICGDIKSTVCSAGWYTKEAAGPPGCYCGIAYRMYKRERSFSFGSYIFLLGSYPDDVSIDEIVRDNFSPNFLIISHGWYITL